MVRLYFRVQMKNSPYNQQKSIIQPTVLNQIFKAFGGSVKNGMLTYSSYSYGSAKKVINYFDHFNLLSSKHVNFLKWRKAYILIQNKDHLTETGLNKITKLKKTMNRKNEDNS